MTSSAVTIMVGARACCTWPTTLVPGKKQWTWGNGDFGRAWDRQLTDEDGPYIELMCGAFTDNQPDFSWLMPGEEKRFTQVFMPYKEIGPATNASKDAVISLEVDDGSATIGVHLTSRREVHVMLNDGENFLYSEEVELSPELPLLVKIPLPPDTDPGQLVLSVWADHQVLVDFRSQRDKELPAPEPAAAALPPSEIGSNEELYLNGAHLEQYRHATFPPEPYYREALRRDPADSRCYNALGLLLLRRGKFAEAEEAQSSARHGAIPIHTMVRPFTIWDLRSSFRTSLTKPVTLSTRRSGMRLGRARPVWSWRALAGGGDNSTRR